MPLPFTNPYPDPSHKIVARVSSLDYFDVKKLFPYHGITDVILSNLYFKFVNELKSRGLDPLNPDHQAWHTEHPNIAVLRDVLAQCNFEPRSGLDVGQAGARDDGRGADGIRETVQPPVVVGANTKSSSRKGGNRPRRSKETKEKG